MVAFHAALPLFDMWIVSSNVSPMARIIMLQNLVFRHTAGERLIDRRCLVNPPVLVLRATRLRDGVYAIL